MPTSDDVPARDVQPADHVEGDRITVGDITRSVTAVGRGASVIIKNALSSADEAREQEAYEREKLALAIADLAESLNEQINAPYPAEGNPYKSILEYTLADAPRFFGRGQAFQDLVSNLTCRDSRCRLVVLHGDPGVGKTSLIRAGVVPALVAEQHLPLVVRVTPGDPSLVSALKRSLLPHLGATPDLEKANLQGFVRHVTDLLPAGKRLFVLLDQFESFFGLPQDARREFLNELALCLADEDYRDHWLICIRSPWLARLSSFQPAISQPFANVLDLPPLSREQASSAVRETAGLRGLTYDPDLLEVLLTDLGDEEIDPSQLQLVCYTLLEHLPPGEKNFSLGHYRQSGGSDAILRDHLDDFMARNLAPADREPAWQLLAAVARWYERPVTKASLIEYMQTYALASQDVQRILGQLEDNRVLRLRGEHYELPSGLLPRVMQWEAERAASKQIRQEVARQWQRVRGSALRGLVGGTLGFTAAYALAYFRQPVGARLDLFPYLVLLRTAPGAFAGLVVTLGVDIAAASYRGPQRRVRWLLSGLAGAFALMLAVSFQALLLGSTKTLPELALSLVSGGLEGALWGLVIGLGALWVLERQRPAWQTLPVAALAGGVTLWLADFIGNAFGSPPSPLLLIAAGAVMPACVIAASLLGDRYRGTG